MSESVHVDLSGVYSAINTVNQNIGIVADQIKFVGNSVELVAQEQAGTRQRLEQLYDEFQGYIEKDDWTNEVNKANHELSLVRQALDKQFGYRDEVRHHTTGILQAVDVGVIRENTIHTAAEELMAKCPGYWLAPCLLALSGWICDNRALAEKALAEAIRRDDSKTSLFFCLISQRARRIAACGRWLVRYFQLQDPTAMDREVVVMLDALANGIFGFANLTRCSEVIEEWLAELEQQAGFPDEQRKRWAEALDVMTPKLRDDEYPTLRKYSPTWSKLEATLAAARRNEVVQSFFERMFTDEIVVPPSLETAVDDILSSLVTKYDDEEADLHRKDRYYNIVKEVDTLPGRAREKLSEVERLFQAEYESLKEQQSFAGLLTNAAMYHERLGATPATQRYAVSRSRQWIAAGFNDLTARDRAQVPAEAEIACGSWKGTSRDGSNEQPLSADLTQHYANRIEQAIKAVEITKGTWIVTIIGALIGLMFLSGSVVFGLLVIAGAGGYLYFQYQNLEKVRQRAREALEKERDDATRILKAGLAELTDLRRETAKEDRKADHVLALLEALSSPQFILKRPDQARTVIA